MALHEEVVGLVGLWMSPYVKMYSVSGTTRIAEISTYPRCYEDTVLHLYTVDTPFVVTEDDLNYYYRDVNKVVHHVYRDTEGEVFEVGQSAVHFINEGLAGSFPKWIGSESLSGNNSTDNEYIFLIDIIPHQATITEVEHQRNGIWVTSGALVVAELNNQYPTRILRIPKQKNWQPKSIGYIKFTVLDR